MSLKSDFSKVCVCVNKRRIVHFILTIFLAKTWLTPSIPSTFTKTYDVCISSGCEFQQCLSLGGSCKVSRDSTPSRTPGFSAKSFNTVHYHRHLSCSILSSFEILLLRSTCLSMPPMLVSQESRTLIKNQSQGLRSESKIKTGIRKPSDPLTS